MCKRKTLSSVKKGAKKCAWLLVKKELWPWEHKLAKKAIASYIHFLAY